MSMLVNLLTEVKTFFKENKWPFILFLSLGVLFLIIVQKSGRQLFGSDFILCGYGYDFMSESLRSGKIPYWNPFINCGMPQMASMNNLMLFPTATIYLLLGMTSNSIFLYECFTAIVIGAALMYLFIKTLGVSKVTASLAGAFFAASGSFLTYINPGHDNMMLSIALLPGTFYFINRGIKSGKLIDYLLSGCILGLQSLLCLYQMTSYLAVCMIAFFGFLLFSERKGFKHITYFSLGLLTAPLFGAVQLFQSFYFIKHTFRSAVNYEFFTSWSLHPIETIVYIYPKFFGFLESTYWGKSQFWLHNDYLGIIPWIFVLAAVFFVFKDKRVKFFLCLAASTMILAFGGYTPLYELLFKIPVVNGFRNSSRWLGFFAFSIITLAAFGFEYIKEYFTAKKEPAEINKMKVYLKTLLVVGIVFTCVYFIFSGARGPMVDNLKGVEQFNKRFPAQNLDFVANILYLMIKDDMFLFVLYFSIGLTLVYLMVKGKLGKGLFFAGCLLMVFFDNGVRFLAPRSFNVGGNEYISQCVKTEPANQEDPRRAEIREVLSRDTSLFRVMPTGDLFNKNWFIADKIQSCGGYHSAPLENYNTVQGKGLLNNLPFLGLLNAKYVLSETAINHPYLKVVNDGRVKIYQNIAVMPRAFLYSKVSVLDKEKMFISMQEPSFNAASSIIINESLPGPLDEEKYSGKEAVITKYEGSKITLDVDSPGNSMLFLSEVFYPEWKAYVDGKETKIYQAFGLFRSVYLTKGKHTVEFKWDGKIFYLGALVSFFTLIFILIYALFFLRNKQKSIESVELNRKAVPKKGV